jgi:hypothetical protein
MATAAKKRAPRKPKVTKPVEPPVEPPAAGLVPLPEEDMSAEETKKLLTRGVDSLLIRLIEKVESGEARAGEMALLYQILKDSGVQLPDLSGLNEIVGLKIANMPFPRESEVAAETG